MKNKGKSSASGILLAALAAAGTYLLYRKWGSKNREKIVGWTIQLRKELLKQEEKLKDFNQTDYEQIIDDVAKRYVRVKEVSAFELWHITEELKSAWAHICDQLK